MLLSGPPGNGKTSVAEAIAEAMAAQFFTVRYDALVGSYLGETNTRLARLFDYARTVPCVLFFDEFDLIGKERDIHETGEIKRVVSFLLMQIDQLPSYVVAVAATNYAELLDRAVWRRFQLRLALPQPSLDALAVFFDRQFECMAGAWQALRPTSLPLDWDETALPKHLNFAKPSGASTFSLGKRALRDILYEHLELWSTRVAPSKEADAPRSGETSPSPERSKKHRQAAIGRRRGRDLAD